MKDKTAAGLFAIFLGFLGVHRFYLGQVGHGILYILFSWTGIPLVISFIEGIVFLSMNDDTFDLKYNASRIARTMQRDAYQTTYQQRHAPPSADAYNAPRRVVHENQYKKEGTRLYREYDYRGAVEQYERSVQFQPYDPQVHFNMACLYSLLENVPLSFQHLEIAVKQGYKNFESIKAHGHLAYLRTQPQFEAFEQNGYRTTANALQGAPMTELNLERDEELRRRMERLESLFQRGIINEKELQRQKDKLLNNY